MIMTTPKTNTAARLRQPTRSRVFVIEPQRQDITQVSQYGEIVHVFSAREPAGYRKPSVYEEEYFDEVVRRLQAMNFDVENDYILCVGGIMIVVLAVLKIVAEFGDVRGLFHHAPTHGYIERPLQAYATDEYDEDSDE